MANLKRKPKSASETSNETPRRVKLYFHGEAETPAERMAAIRQLRKGQILNYLLNEGPASRVDISRALGFNLRTVSLLVSSLIKDNVVVEKPVKISTAMGRRPVPLELNSAAACVMAVDVDRHQTTFALLDLQGNILVRDQRPSDFTDDPAEQAQWLVKVATEFLDKSHGNLPPLAGCGFSFDGFVFRQHAASHHGTVTEPMREALEETLQVPVSSDTNSRLIAIAEQRFGSAEGARNALTINVGEGFSLGCIIDGKVLIGDHGMAGELGHIPLGEPGVPCYCGSSGCLENIVSGSGIKRMAEKAGIAIPSERSAVATLIESAKNDKVAAGILDEFLKRLALAIVISANLYDPETIVIAGHAAAQLQPCHDQLVRHIGETSVPFIMEQISIGYSTLGDDAVLLGAGGQILNHIYSAAHVNAESLL